MYAVKNDHDSPKLLLRAFVFPCCFVTALWLVKLIEEHYSLNFSSYGIYPRVASGLIGILTGPFVHDSFNHLINNSFPLLVLGTAIYYSYKEVRWKIFFWAYFMTNLWVWAAARNAYHIGASGLVYAFASFVFFSGIIRKNIKLMALSLLVVFLYGSMVWGIFPIDYRVSFEAHLFGTIAGLLLAIYFRKEGPQRERYSWELEEEEESDEAGPQKTDGQIIPLQ
jgi:membrane associated rhomboid family serine protease